MQTHDSVNRARAAGASAQHVEIRKVGFDAPWGWLAAGWRDLWAAPHISLLYGAAFSLAAYGFAFLLMRFDLAPLILPLAGGFLVGPLLAVGLYEVSRRRASGEPITLGSALGAGGRARGQIAFMGVILLIVFFAWIRLAFLLFMLFFGPGAIPPIEEFIPALLFSQQGIGLLVTGTIAGALLAGLTFAISVISVPMLLDREVDTITAVIASIRAVVTNTKAMALWAALIVALTVVGIVTVFAGLAIVFPLIGHATWHAYKDVTGA